MADLTAVAENINRKYVGGGIVIGAACFVFTWILLSGNGTWAAPLVFYQEPWGVVGADPDVYPIRLIANIALWFVTGYVVTASVSSAYRKVIA